MTLIGASVVIGTVYGIPAYLGALVVRRLFLGPSTTSRYPGRSDGAAGFFHSEAVSE